MAKQVSQLEPGDVFGPVAGLEHDGELTVIAIKHARLVGAGGGLRNIYRIIDHKSRVWYAAGTRWSDDCYGWKREWEMFT